MADCFRYQCNFALRVIILLNGVNFLADFFFADREKIAKTRTRKNIKSATGSLCIVLLKTISLDYFRFKQDTPVVGNEKTEKRISSTESNR